MRCEAGRQEVEAVKALLDDEELQTSALAAARTQKSEIESRLEVMLTTSSAEQKAAERAATEAAQTEAALEKLRAEREGVEGRAAALGVALAEQQAVAARAREEEAELQDAVAVMLKDKAAALKAVEELQEAQRAQEKELQDTLTQTALLRTTAALQQDKLENAREECDAETAAARK